jgi:hypothetical protein
MVLHAAKPRHELGFVERSQGRGLGRRSCWRCQLRWARRCSRNGLSSRLGRRSDIFLSRLPRGIVTPTSGGRRQCDNGNATNDQGSNSHLGSPVHQGQLLTTVCCAV